jgi:hypothetical protein
MVRSLGSPFVLAVAAGLLGLAVGADLAGACTCADHDERDRLEAGEKAILGRVVGAPAFPVLERAPVYTVRVSRVSACGYAETST